MTRKDVASILLNYRHLLACYPDIRAALVALQRLLNKQRDEKLFEAKYGPGGGLENHPWRK